MTARNIISIVLRLWATVWVVGTVTSMATMLVFATHATNGESRHIFVSNFVVGVVWIVLGCVLFFQNERLAAALFPKTEGELAIAATSQELQAVGFSLLAIYFGCHAVSRLAGILYEFVRTPTFGDQSRFSGLAQNNPENLVTTAAQLIVAVILFFGSKGLSAFWNRVRGRNQSSPGAPRE